MILNERWVENSYQLIRISRSTGRIFTSFHGHVVTGCKKRFCLLYLEDLNGLAIKLFDKTIKITSLEGK